MQIRKTRWSKVYESSEEELVTWLQSRNIQTTRWMAAEFEQLEVRTLPIPTDLYLAEGSAKLQADTTTYSLQPGDTIHFPANTKISLTAGMSGCVCYETVG